MSCSDMYFDGFDFYGNSAFEHINKAAVICVICMFLLLFPVPANLT